VTEHFTILITKITAGWNYRKLNLRTGLKNQNSILVEIKSRLKSGIVCYHSEQNILSSCLPSKSITIKIYRTVILPAVLCGCETSVTLKEERRLRVFENRVLREIFGAEWDKVVGSGENYITRSLMFSTAHQIILW
jgi:hypothetical protein